MYKKGDEFQMGLFDRFKDDMEKNKNKLIDNIKEKNDKRKKEEERKRKEEWEKNKPLLIKSGIILIIIFSVLGVMSLIEDDENKEKDIENKVEQVSKEETKETKETEEQEDEEKKITESIYEDAIGKMAYETFEDLDKEGFEVKFIHASSKQDFTTAVQFASDPNDTEAYVPWIITELDSFDAKNKYASFYINTQENMDAEQENKNIEERLTAKLSPSVAWGSLRIYGEKQFPYGFKVKQVTGTLAETAIDEDTWFIKAKCEIKNSNGVWDKNAVCEAEITGTNDAPRVISFNVYNP